MSHLKISLIFGVRLRSVKKSNILFTVSDLDRSVIERSIELDNGPIGTGKKYLASISEEHSKSRVSPHQAVPFFFDKFTKVCSYLSKGTFLPSISPLERYIVSRDLAFFCLVFYSGDRASDLGRVYTKEVLLPKKEQGLLIHHKIGKTLQYLRC